MSFISTRSRYGLRFLVELCQRSGEGPVDLGSIAKHQAIPEPYLAKLVLPLRDAGIVRSERGAKGGYALAKAPPEITVESVVAALEGRTSLLECTQHPEICSRSADCPTLPVWQGLERAISEYLAGITVGDLASPRELDYSI